MEQAVLISSYRYCTVFGKSALSSALSLGDGARELLAGLRVVHGRLRHARSEGGQGVAQDVDVVRGGIY